jgi:hypothetical protein
MQSAARLTFAGKSFAVSVALICWLSTLPTAAAQGPSFQGQDAVYDSSNQVTNSPAFIDASMFASSAPNICGILHSILIASSYPSAGAVIDARGRVAQTTGFVSFSRVPRPSSAWAGLFHA